MVKRIFLVVALSMLLIGAMYTFKFQSRAELTEAEVNALPGELRTAAIEQRNTRLQMAGSTWVFAGSGSSEAVTDGDVSKAKLALSFSEKK